MRTLTLLVLAFTIAGCPTADPDPEPTPEPTPDPSELPEPGDLTLNGPCELEDRYGAFLVESTETYTIVQGQVSQGVVPISVLEETATDGDCRLMKRNNPYCTPACQAGETCDFNSDCIPFPAAQDLGQVGVRGLVQDIVIDPVQPGWNYFNTTLPHPAIRPDETIRVRTGAGTWDSFDLYGIGVEDLELPASETWRVEEGVDTQLSWTASTSSNATEVFFTLNIDQHGNTPTSLQCTFDDDGAATVPAAMVELLTEAGVSGWPSGRMSRRTVDSTAVGEGCVDLTVSSPRSAEIDLIGYYPCNQANPCPEGLACNYAIELCE